MRLGFDLDEVVVDLNKSLNEYIENNYGIPCIPEMYINYDIKKVVFDENEDLNSRIKKDITQLLYDPDFQYNSEPVVGARETLQKLKRVGHKLFFISSRPKPNQSITFKWLRANDIPFDDLKVIGHDKVKGYYGMKLRLDMFVDDLEVHLESMWRFKRRWKKGLLLYSRPWNSDSIDASRFSRVDNWKEILRHVGIQNR